MRAWFFILFLAIVSGVGIGHVVWPAANISDGSQDDIEHARLNGGMITSANLQKMS